MNNRKRTIGINIRVTAKEKQRIVHLAKKCKLSVSEYLRQLAFAHDPKIPPSDDIYEDCKALQALITQTNDPFLKQNLAKIQSDLYALCYPAGKEENDGNHENLGCSGQSETAC